MKAPLNARVQFRNRETGEVEVEKVFGEGGLRWLYESLTGRAVSKVLLTRAVSSHIYGSLQNRRSSKRKVPNFIAKLGIDPDEAAEPLESYGTMNAFFTRKLREGARPIDRDPQHLVSPADGRVLVFPEVPGELTVKNSRVTLAQLLGDPALAERYVGGALVVVRLAPADYHRFHFPDAGEASPSKRWGGPLHSVHTIALDAGAPSFRNKREVSTLQSAQFGELALIEVGAMLVGQIVQTYTPGPVERGQEKGMFRFGGSTCVVVVEPGRVVWDEDLVRDSADGLETLVKMGTRIGVRA